MGSEQFRGAAEDFQKYVKKEEREGFGSGEIDKYMDDFESFYKRFSGIDRSSLNTKEQQELDQTLAVIKELQGVVDHADSLWFWETEAMEDEVYANYRKNIMAAKSLMLSVLTNAVAPSHPLNDPRVVEAPAQKVATHRVAALEDTTSSKKSEGEAAGEEEAQKVEKAAKTAQRRAAHTAKPTRQPKRKSTADGGKQAIRPQDKRLKTEPQPEPAKGPDGAGKVDKSTTGAPTENERMAAEPHDNLEYWDKAIAGKKLERTGTKNMTVPWNLEGKMTEVTIDITNDDYTVIKVGDKVGHLILGNMFATAHVSRIKAERGMKAAVETNLTNGKLERIDLEKVIKAVAAGKPIKKVAENVELTIP